MANTLWRKCLAVCSFLLFGLLLHHHWQILSAPIPLDLYEGTMPWITSLIADGHNPYTRALQPQAMNVYPPLYNLLVAPLTNWFGNSLELHRAVSALFIAYAAILCGFTAFWHSGSRVYGCAAAVLLYAALLFYSTPVASTNALGVALFLSAVIIPWRQRFSPASLATAVLCSVFAFYSKQYFILGMAIVCLYTFLYVSMSRALLAGMAFAITLLSSLLWVHLHSPYFLDNTLFSTQAAMRNVLMIEVLLLQLSTFIQIYAGILLILAIHLWRSGRDGLRRLVAVKPRTQWCWTNGFLEQAPDFFLFALFWSSLAVIVSIGGNPGNYMTYLFQLMSPFLLIAASRILCMPFVQTSWLAPLLLISLVQAYLVLPRDFSTDLSKWEAMYTLIEEEDEILATQMLLMALLERDKRIHQDGHTFYFPAAASKPELFRKKDPQARVEAIWAEYMTGLYRKIEAKEFGLILISPWEMRGIFKFNPPPFSQLPGKEFLRKHYYKEQVIPLSMTDRYGGGTYQVQVWRPREAASPL